MAVSLSNHSEGITNHPPLYEWTGRGQGGRMMCGPLLTPAGRGGKFSGGGGRGGGPPPPKPQERSGIWAFSAILGESEALRRLYEKVGGFQCLSIMKKKKKKCI